MASKGFGSFIRNRDTMVNEEPKVAKTGRYTPTETAKILGIHRNTLNGYRKNGMIKFGVRRSSARVFYTGSEILRLWKTL